MYQAYYVLAHEYKVPIRSQFLNLPACVVSYQLATASVVVGTSVTLVRNVYTVARGDSACCYQSNETKPWGLILHYYSRLH